MPEAFKCPSCNTATWGDLKFCPKCGESLDIKCAECGYSLRYVMATDMNFCPKCGKKMKEKNKHGQKDKEKKQ